MKSYRHHLCSVILLAAVLLSAGQSVQGATRIRVATYNVMSKVMADSVLPWQMRSTRICMQMHQLDVDVIGFQEVTPVQLTDLSQGLPDYAVASIPWDLADSTLGTVPIFYRKDKYKLVERGYFWLSDTPEVPSAGWGNQPPYAVCWTILQNINDRSSFIFANTLYDESNDKAHLESSMLAKTCLGKISNGIPVILAGDFNITSRDISYSTLLTRIFPMQDAWTAATQREGVPNTYNGLGRVDAGQKRIVEFIFTSIGVKVRRASIETSAQSDGIYLSDHNLLWADLSWKP